MHRFSFFFLVVILSTTTVLSAQHKTPWGDPDLQGIWSNQSPTPLERPDALAGKQSLTEEEAAEFEKTSLERLLTTFAREVPISGELNEIWLETAKGRVPPGRSTSLVVDPPDGKIPYTPEGRKRWDAVPKIGAPLLANAPEDRTLAERCITTDGLLVPNPFYNNYFRIVQAPGYVAILYEMIHETRVIPLDGREPVGKGIRQDMGDARGRWEGDTLVVTTKNFKDRSAYRNANAETLTLTERFQRIAPDQVRWAVTVDDPSTWTKPWTFSLPLTADPNPLPLYECHEGNYGLKNILSAARAEEREQ